MPIDPEDRQDRILIAMIWLTILIGLLVVWVVGDFEL